jgi:predicted Zn-dependent protease with MMP-like domain
MEPEDVNGQLEKLYSSAEAASSEGLVDEAIRRCETALEMLDMHPDEDVTFTHADFLMVAGHACWEDGDIEAAQRFYRQAYEIDISRVDAMVAVGVSLFHLCRFQASHHYLELASVEDPEIAEVWYYLALLALRRNDRGLAELFFERAHELEPDRWLRPRFVDFPEVERILTDLLNSFPPEILKVIENVAIIVEDRPDDELLHSNEPPLDPLMLGIFEGTPFPEESAFGAAETPNRILIFAENIALIAEDENRLHEELGITLKHEIGHFLGLDEDELAERGLD